MKPNDKLIINNKRYRINQFETNLTNGKTKLELINEIADGIVIEPEVDETIDDTPTDDGTTDDPVTIVSISSTTAAMSTESNACSSSIGSGDVLYTDSTYFYPIVGDYVYTDAAGTTPAAAGWYKHQYQDLYKLNSSGLVIQNAFCQD